jgi:hypothetical protein
MIPVHVEVPGAEEQLVAQALPNLFTGLPAWFPHGVPVHGVWQMPCIRAPQYDSLPTEMRAFDKSGSLKQPADAILHHYTSDRRLRPRLRQPERDTAKYARVWGITSPDFSMGSHQPLCFRAQAVWCSRAVAAYHVLRGVRVVPSVRWSCSDDYDFCFDGIERGSLVAVSNYGCRRDRELHQSFLAGLSQLVERVEPEAVLVYGSTNYPAFRALAGRTRFIEYLPEVERFRGEAV